MRGVVFEFLHAGTEPLVSIVVIVGDAGTERRPGMRSPDARCLA